MADWHRIDVQGDAQSIRDEDRAAVTAWLAEHGARYAFEWHVVQGWLYAKCYAAHPETGERYLIAIGEAARCDVTAPIQSPYPVESAVTCPL